MKYSDKHISMASETDVKPFLIKSLVLHGLVVLLVSGKYFMFPSEPITYIPSIKVDVVALPEKTKPEPAPEPAPPAPKPKPVVKKPEVTKPKPKPVAKKEPKKVNLDKNKKSEEIRRNAIERMKALEKIKSQVQAEQQTETLVKGNRISPGTAMTGLTKLDYNQYIGRLQQHAKANWAIPRWLAGSDLSADIRVYIDERGYVVRKELIRSSGDQSFDDSVVAAITNASPFPAPEDKFIDVVRVSGIVFTLRP